MGQHELPTLFTAAQVGECLGMTEEAVRKLVADRDLDARRIGEGDEGLRFLPADVMAYFDTIRTGPSIEFVLPAPEVDLESGMIKGLWDLYHDLHVGPCTPEMLETEDEVEIIHEIWSPQPNQYDCSYPEWVEHFRAETYDFAASGKPMPAADYRVPTQRDLKHATLTVLTRGTILLTDGRRIEKRGERWAFVARDGSYLRGVDEPGYEMWCRDSEPTLTFETPLEAYRAWARSDAVFESRCERRDAAGMKLGRNLDDDPEATPAPRIPPGAPVASESKRPPGGNGKPKERPLR